jgi:hypothetical protein
MLPWSKSDDLWKRGAARSFSLEFKADTHLELL